MDPADIIRLNQADKISYHVRLNTHHICRGGFSDQYCGTRRYALSQNLGLSAVETRPATSFIRLKQANRIPYHVRLNTPNICRGGFRD